MNGTIARTNRHRRLLQAGALVCGLLSVVASFNLTVLAGCLDRNLPPPAINPSLSELEESLDDDDEMIRPAATSLDSRRGERKHPPPRSGQTGPQPSPSRRPPFLLSCSLASAARPGCEHAHRNGLGAPLLC
jgi:hypothetical protein